MSNTKDYLLPLFIAALANSARIGLAPKDLLTAALTFVASETTLSIKDFVGKLNENLSPTAEGLAEHKFDLQEKDSHCTDEFCFYAGTLNLLKHDPNRQTWLKVASLEYDFRTSSIDDTTIDLP